nr:pyruvate formate lyase family protein [Sedimentibacter sp.]
MAKVLENADVFSGWELSGKQRSLKWRAGMEERTGSTDRVKNLNEQYHSVLPSICLHRARAFTEVYKQTEGVEPVLRHAMAVAKALDDTPPFILDGELIVGGNSCKPKCHPLHAEVDSAWIMREGGMEALGTRQFSPFFATKEQIKEFDEEIYPYWKDKTTDVMWRKAAPDYLVERTIGTGFADSQFPINHLGSHCTLDWVEILRRGTNGYKREAQERLESWDPMIPADYGKNHFWKATIMVLEAMERFARKYADLAAELARKETDSTRKAELKNISNICSRMPHEPAETFQEAIQSVWFMFCFFDIDGTGPIMSPGRIDQYLNPFYEKDKAEGRTTRETAQEMIECLWIKMANILDFGDAGNAYYMSGYTSFLTAQVGGVDKYGNDVTNELSYIMMDALIETHTNQPNLSVRFHDGTPEELKMKTAELIATGMGFPSIFNDRAAKQMMLNAGFNAYDANDYAAAGCMEVQKQGWYWWMPAAWVNLGMAVDLALTNGIKRTGVMGDMQGKRISAETGNPRNFKTYEEFENAVKQHIKTQVDYGFIADTTTIEVFQNYPLIVQSVFTNSGLERGLPVHSGGVFASACPAYDVVGIPDVGNSCATVKKLVFDDKKITMAQLCDALDANFEGYEDIYQMCMNVPKWGNDDDYVDTITQRLINYTNDEVQSHPGILAKRDPDKETANVRHRSKMCISPVSANVSFGISVGALPSGRKLGEPLGDSCAPYAGTDKNGPTAALKSVAKLGTERIHGAITNLWIDGNNIKDKSGKKKMMDLVDAFFDGGGAHVQINTVDKETLINAQKTPEKYPALLVRVSGFSAYFVDLAKEIQDMIISRTEHNV